jgi:hypothetical protein
MENTKSIIDNIKNDVELKQLKDENESLKNKINSLRSDNNSFLYAALVKAQSEMPVADKNSTVYGRQKYTNLADVVRISRPILVKNGLAVTQMFLNDILITRLVHSSGQFIESSLKLVINSKDEKTNSLHLMGASITYFRRYCYSSIIGLVTDEDTDGN